MPNGATFRQCSRMPGPNAGGVGCHTPGSVVAGRNVCGGVDPSLARSLIIACAAASPTAMPSVFDWLSGILLNDVARAASRSGAPEKYVFRTRYAAAMAAASADAPAGAT